MENAGIPSIPAPQETSRARRCGAPKQKAANERRPSRKKHGHPVIESRLL